MISTKNVVALCAFSFAAGGSVVWAQQQAQASRREPQFENDQLRVWKSIVMPGQPLALHRHEHGRALVSLNGGELQVVDKDKKVLDTYKLTAGKAIWLGVDPPGQMHADVNPGKTPVEVIVVQLQQDTVKKK
jgi:quercetin dioxygenase-like cupin family protein